MRMRGRCSPASDRFKLPADLAEGMGLDAAAVAAAARAEEGAGAAAAAGEGEEEEEEATGKGKGKGKGKAAAGGAAKRKRGGKAVAEDITIGEVLQGSAWLWQERVLQWPGGAAGVASCQLTSAGCWVWKQSPPCLPGRQQRCAAVSAAAEEPAAKKRGRRKVKADEAVAPAGAAEAAAGSAAKAKSASVAGEASGSGTVTKPPPSGKPGGFGSSGFITTVGRGCWRVAVHLAGKCRRLP